jgi:hypothetical protein
MAALRRLIDKQTNLSTVVLPKVIACVNTKVVALLILFTLGGTIATKRLGIRSSLDKLVISLLVQIRLVCKMIVFFFFGFCLFL